MCVTAGFLMTTVFTWALQTELAKNDANELIRLNIEDVREDILEASNKNLLELTREIASRIDFTDRTNAKLLKTLKKNLMSQR